jgi:hypothetical protein
MVMDEATEARIRQTLERLQLDEWQRIDGSRRLVDRAVPAMPTAVLADIALDLGAAHAGIGERVDDAELEEHLRSAVPLMREGNVVKALR